MAALRHKQPAHLQNYSKGQCPEWQRGRTVNPLAERLRRFESYLAHYFTQADTSFAAAPPQAGICQGVFIPGQFAHVAQPAERILGKNEVMGSNPIVGF